MNNKNNKSKKGNILRVKQGYNPNSSSIGSSIPKYLTFAISSGALTVLILNINKWADKHIRSKNKDKEKEP